MKNICSNNFIICLGDDIRYRFAQELMPTGHIINTNSLKINKSYIFIHSDEENVIADDKKILVYTSKLHDGRILEFPVSGIDVKTVLADQQKIHIGKVLIFADFPYKKENLHYLVEKVCNKSKNASVNVILFNENRRAGFTDIEKSDKIIKEAYSEFGMFGITVKEYAEGDDKTDILTVKTNNLRYFKNKYRKELKGSQYRIENRFEIHYKTFLERTYEHYFSFNNPEEFSRFVKLFEYGNIPAETNDLWKAFADDFKNMYLFPSSDIMNEISEFYLDYISEILHFRLKEEDVYIREAAVKLFDRYFENHPVLATGKNEFEFKEILNKNNVVTEFTNKIETFFSTQLRQMLFSLAMGRIKTVIQATNDSANAGSQN